MFETGRKTKNVAALIIGVTALALALAHDAHAQNPHDATSPHVKVSNKSWCGSGTICGTTIDGAYVLTNAHVAGTTLGHTVVLDIVTTSGTKKTEAQTVHTGYDSRRMVDWAILFAPKLTCTKPMQLDTKDPNAEPFAHHGSPRCVWPQVTQRFDDVQMTGNDLMTGSPNAIGGQSGSAIYNALENQVGLITWSMGGRAAGQTTHKIYLVARSGNAGLADERPEGLEEVQRTGERPITTNGIQRTVRSPVQELPIWLDQDKPDPTPPCDEPGPTYKPCVTCGANPPQDAVGDERFDWNTILQIVQLIMELIRNSQ